MFVRSFCLCQVPSHTGTPGNERANREARRTLTQEESCDTSIKGSCLQTVATAVGRGTG